MSKNNIGNEISNKGINPYSQDFLQRLNRIRQLRKIKENEKSSM
jgi:hypothetical protein